LSPLVTPTIATLFPSPKRSKRSKRSRTPLVTPTIAKLFQSPTPMFYTPKSTKSKSKSKSKSPFKLSLPATIKSGSGVRYDSDDSYKWFGI
jgi:hypothetical protein